MAPCFPSTDRTIPILEAKGNPELPRARPIRMLRQVVAALLVGVVDEHPIHMRVAMGRHQHGMQVREHLTHLPLIVAKRLLGTPPLAHPILTRMVEKRRRGMPPRGRQTHTAQTTVDRLGVRTMAVGHRVLVGEEEEDGEMHLLHGQRRRKLGYVPTKDNFRQLPHCWMQAAPTPYAAPTPGFSAPTPGAGWNSAPTPAPSGIAGSSSTGMHSAPTPAMFGVDEDDSCGCSAS